MGLNIGQEIQTSIQPLLHHISFPPRPHISTPPFAPYLLPPPSPPSPDPRPQVLGGKGQLVRAVRTLYVATSLLSALETRYSRGHVATLLVSDLKILVGLLSWMRNSGPFPGKMIQKADAVCTRCAPTHVPLSTHTCSHDYAPALFPDDY